MKRFLSILLMLVTLLSLCACTAQPQPTEPAVTEPTEPACQHEWLDATCATLKTCSVCGATDGSAIGHSWKEGICTVCKAEDPSFDPLVNGTWLYLTKERWQVFDFHPDGTCDIKNVNGAPTSAVTLEEGVNKAIANLQRQYPDSWETYAASKYYVFKIGDYYYVANVTATTSEYTTDGKNITIEQEGFLPVYLEMMGRKTLQDAVDESRYINMEVRFISNLFIQYKNINNS